jgi:hypothetical protein
MPTWHFEDDVKRLSLALNPRAAHSAIIADLQLNLPALSACHKLWWRCGAIWVDLLLLLLLEASHF